MSTQALSGAGFLKMLNKATDAVSKMTIKMNESDVVGVPVVVVFFSVPRCHGDDGQGCCEAVLTYRMCCACSGSRRSCRRWRPPTSSSGSSTAWWSPWWSTGKVSPAVPHHTTPRRVIIQPHPPPSRVHGS